MRYGSRAVRAYLGMVIEKLAKSESERNRGTRPVDYRWQVLLIGRHVAVAVDEQESKESNDVNRSRREMKLLAEALELVQVWILLCF